MTYLPLSPVNWPQDKARVPNGVGMMPPVEFNNKSRIEAEYTCMYGEVQFLGASPNGTVVSAIINTDQDGDFWCDQISVVETTSISPLVNGALEDTSTTISDLRTGRTLTYPSVPTRIFNKLQPNGLGAPSPAFLRDTGTLIQPFCFTRQGGIKLDVRMNFNPGFDILLSFGFSGWKEYSNASR